VASAFFAHALPTLRENPSTRTRNAPPPAIGAQQLSSQDAARHARARAMPRPSIPWPLLVFAAVAFAQGGSGGRATPPSGLRRTEPLPLDMAGKPIEQYPHFQHARTFNEGDPIHVAFDPKTVPRLSKRVVALHVIEHDDLPLLLAGQELATPARRFQLTGGGVRENIFLLDAGTLSGTSSPDHEGTLLLGKGYDIVADLDGNRRLDAGDLIDGSLARPGFTVVENFVDFRDQVARTTGPYDVKEALYDGGAPFEQQQIFFPANVSALGELPLIVVSHGNGHDYRWYDHLGYHMASWGYVLMSHRNNTGPGIETASTTTLSNTEVFLARLDVIAEGMLLGHVDSHLIVWMGHSRGGEGVVRAYRRLEQGTPLATRYGIEDVKLVSSIAPTDFLGPESSNMGAAPYHLWTGGADNDVNGCADCNICQTFHLLERADGPRFSISLHGAGHADFHDNPSSSVANGPCRLGRTKTHQVMRAVLLPLVQYTLHENEICLDFLTRQWEEFRATGAPDPALLPDNECVVVDLQHVPGPGSDRRMVDDFQTSPALLQSSSGARVQFSEGLDAVLFEGRLDDNNNHFTPVTVDPMNGMTLAGPGDDSRGAVLTWSHTDEWILFEVREEWRDLGSMHALSFRAAQTTRRPETTAEFGDLDLSIQLLDRSLNASTIRISAYGGGIEEPYQRSGCGTSIGWANEFETIRIPLADFRRDGNPIDLTDVLAVGFLFGPSHGSPVGRIGLDEILFTSE
jgi:hypothetical protein